MIVLVAITFLLISSFQKGNCEEMCQTKSCLETAARVLNSMNETADPCEDFFEFACRGWIRNNPIPKHAQSWSTTSAIKEEVELRLNNILDTPDKEEDGRPIKMARSLYRSCMDSQTVENLGVKPLIDAFTKLGLAISPPTDEEAATLDIPKIAGSVLRHYGVSIFFKVFVRQDSNNSSIHRLVASNALLEQLRPDFANLDMYLRNPIRFRTKVKAYKNYIQGMMQLAGMKEKSEKYAIEIMQFETEIAKVRIILTDSATDQITVKSTGPVVPKVPREAYDVMKATPKEMDRENYMHHDVTIWELQKFTDPDAKHWNWTTYMNALVEETDVIVDPKNDNALIEDVGYIKGLPLLLRKTSQGITARYLWWKIYSKIAPQTLKHFRDYLARFGKRVSGFEATWYRCTKIVIKFFEVALTAAYVEKHFNVQNKKTAAEMWSDLISSFDDMLTEYKWMDDETKAQAHRKLHAMNPLIAYPEWITDREKLEEHYKEYEGFEGSLFHMYTNLKATLRKKVLNSWKQTPDRNAWSILGRKVLTYSTVSLNAITIGIDALHEPLYGNAVEALNYGALGAMIGHGITHGFDIYGQQYDENISVREWWSEETMKHYEENVDCVTKQYSEYEVTQLGENCTLDGVLTESENVADMGGLAMAFKAYKKLKARSQPQRAISGLVKYTDEQLFFLGYAQMWCDSFTDAELKRFIKKDQHSPGRFRIIGALRNSAEFAEAWNCSSDSAMNPEKKCTVW